MECCCKHATRCISVQKATGRISVIWLRLVTQFTLVLHEERKKKKERIEKESLAGNLAAANREESNLFICPDLSWIMWVIFMCKSSCGSKNGRLPLGQLLGYAPSRSSVMRCAAPLCSLASVEVWHTSIKLTWRCFYIFIYVLIRVGVSYGAV